MGGLSHVVEKFLAQVVIYPGYSALHTSLDALVDCLACCHLH